MRTVIYSCSALQHFWIGVRLARRRLVDPKTEVSVIDSQPPPFRSIIVMMETEFPATVRALVEKNGGRIVEAKDITEAKRLLVSDLLGKGGEVK